jgi:hypothetical protein
MQENLNKLRDKTLELLYELPPSTPLYLGIFLICFIVYDFELTQYQKVLDVSSVGLGSYLLFDRLYHLQHIARYKIPTKIDDSNISELERRIFEDISSLDVGDYKIILIQNSAFFYKINRDNESQILVTLANKEKDTSSDTAFLGLTTFAGTPAEATSYIINGSKLSRLVMNMFDFEP